MSIYGYLMCHDCRQLLWLGKAVHEHERVDLFHIGPSNEPPNWSRKTLNQVVWKFFADHCSHNVDVRLESRMTDEMFSYQDIGGDGENHITFEKYLEGWRGLG